MPSRLSRCVGKEFQLEESALLSLHWRHEHSANYNKCLSHFLQKTPMQEVLERRGSLCITMKESDMERALAELGSPSRCCFGLLTLLVPGDPIGIDARSLAPILNIDKFSPTRPSGPSWSSS